MYDRDGIGNGFGLPFYLVLVYISALFIERFFVGFLGGMGYIGGIFVPNIFMGYTLFCI